MAATLERNYKEMPVSVGLANDGNVVELDDRDHQPRGKILPDRRRRGVAAAAARVPQGRQRLIFSPGGTRGAGAPPPLSSDSPAVEAGPAW